MLTTPPLAPKTLVALKELGIYTLEDLQKIGTVRAFLLLKASGLTVTKSTLWQLDALVSGVDVRHISEERKTELGEALKNHPPVAVFPSQNDMEAFMRLAIEQARQSAALGEVPVGAVIYIKARQSQRHTIPALATTMSATMPKSTRLLPQVRPCKTTVWKIATCTSH